MKASDTKEKGLPRFGTPDYWELLSSCLFEAKMLLWKRLQHGAYGDDQEAKATMEAYWALKRVVELLEKKIRQIPLPEEKSNG